MIEEIIPLLRLHWEEIAHYKDIPLEVDWQAYANADKNNALRIYSTRESDGTELTGYAVFFIKENPHYKSSKQAVQDVVFIRKDKRGHGKEFLSWCESNLKAEGVEVVMHHIKAAHNWGKMLERMGYELVDLIYAKRLSERLK